MSRTVHWIGKLPDANARRIFGRAGLELVEKRQSSSFARVIHAERTLPQSVADGLPWIWYAGREIMPEVEIDATLRGAYAVAPSLAAAIEHLKELALDEMRPMAPPEMIAESPTSRAILDRIARAARTSMPVLIHGETGTGKEVASRLVHAWSLRRAKRFVPINCAAIPNELMEGELFGYAKGAFSGAVRAYEGALASAAGGTVFLDEIDDTPPSVQTKLLRVLEDRVVTRLGENEPSKVDFRIIAATNRDLRKLIAQHLFGEDLYERLAIVSIRLPSLRERPEDIPVLAHHFIARFYQEEPSIHGKRRVDDFSAAALHALMNYPWPGNVRELRNVVYQALIDKRGGARILPSDLPRRVLKRNLESAAAFPATSPSDTDADPTRIRAAIAARGFSLRREVERLERIALKVALEEARGNASEAARLLGEVGRGSSADPGGTVRAMMKRLGVPAPR